MGIDWTSASLWVFIAVSANAIIMIGAMVLSLQNDREWKRAERAAAEREAWWRDQLAEARSSDVRRPGSTRTRIGSRR